MVSCFYAFTSGCFILLYGSATKVDPTVELVIGTFAMMLSSLLMIVIFFRNSIQPMYRAMYLGLIAIILFAGYPMGIWGGMTVTSKDDPYTPANFSLAGLCRSIFAAS